MNLPKIDNEWRTLVKFPTKYIFSYYFELWEWEGLVDAYEEYLEECDENWDEPEYDNYIEYTLEEGDPDSGLPAHYHWVHDEMVSNYIDSDNICTYKSEESLPVFDDSYSYSNPWEIASIDKIIEDMIWWESLSWYELTSEDLGQYAIFIRDWHHRTLSAIRTMEENPALDFIYVYTNDEWMIELYWVK